MLIHPGLSCPSSEIREILPSALKISQIQLESSWGLNQLHSSVDNGCFNTLTVHGYELCNLSVLQSVVLVLRTLCYHKVFLSEEMSKQCTGFGMPLRNAESES